MRNLVSATTEVEGWDPSESDEDWMILSRSSKTTTEGAWSRASDTKLESAWRMVGGFSKASPEQHIKILHAHTKIKMSFHP